PWSVGRLGGIVFSVRSLHSPWILMPKGVVPDGVNVPTTGAVWAAWRGISDCASDVEWVRIVLSEPELPLENQRTVWPSLIVWKAARCRTVICRSGCARSQ